MSTILNLKDINAGYGNMKILDSVSLQIEENEVTAIIGSNGAGKTTIINTIMGTLKPYSGEIIYKKKDITKDTTHKIASYGISLIPEDRKLFPDLKVYENLLLGAYSRRAWKKRKSTTDYVYELFPILVERKKQEAGLLSGGEQQMLAIARGLMSQPDLLILDEPSLGLAPKIVLEVYEIIKKISGEGVTIIIVEQNVNKALDISKNAYVIENGEVVMCGESKQLLKNPDIKKAYISI